MKLAILQSLALFFGFSACAAESLIGASLADAQKADLFTYFGLKQTASDIDYAQKLTIVSFNPGSEKMSKLVTVKVLLDADKKIAGMEMLLLRAFIDDKVQGMFAADIAKSMLRQMLSPSDLKKGGDLVNEIEYGRMLKGAIVNANNKMPKLPDPPTEGYKTYLGQRAAFEQELDKTKIELKTTKTEKDGDTLLIAVRVK